jgi:hypothetical protein
VGSDLSTDDRSPATENPTDGHGFLPPALGDEPVEGGSDQLGIAGVGVGSRARFPGDAPPAPRCRRACGRAGGRCAGLQPA